MPKSTWSEREIPHLAGRRVIVTGSNSGIGLEAARLFAIAGADVVLAVRSLERGGHAADLVRATTPSARLEVAELDLASLASVRRFAEREAAEGSGIDLLVNNAGTSEQSNPASPDGFEMVIATNFLGPFALTGLLLPLVRPGGRVVTVASVMARRGTITEATTLDDLRPIPGRRRKRAYSDSKQADLLFAVELDRRLRAHSAHVISVACHPGGAATGLAGQRYRLAGLPEPVTLRDRLSRHVLMSARRGAHPTLFAATHPGLRGGELVAPDGILQGRGGPIVVPVLATGRDPRVAAHLWELATEATSVDCGGL